MRARSSSDDRSDAERGVRDLKVEYETRVAARDAEGLTHLYAEDAVRLPPGAPPLAGRVAIRAAWESALAGIASIEDRGRSRIEVHGDLAHEVGTYHISGRGHDGAGFEERGRYITTFRRRDGTWRITPLAVDSSPEISCSRVVLPVPLGPIIAVTSPREMLRFKFLKIRRAPRE